MRSGRAAPSGYDQVGEPGNLPDVVILPVSVLLCKASFAVGVGAVGVGAAGLGAVGLGASGLGAAGSRGPGSQAATLGSAGFGVKQVGGARVRETVLVLGGDVMLNAIAPKVRPLRGLAKTFRTADLALANLEIPLTLSKTATQRKTPEELKRRDQFILKADPGHAKLLGEAGIGMVSLANNHAMDYGPAGLREMTGLLDQLKISRAGAGENAVEAASLTVRTAKNGVRVGMLSALCFLSPKALWKCSPATLTQPGIQVLSFGGRIDKAARLKLQSWIGGARAQCDLLVVAFHWGIERKTAPSPYQRALGRAAIDAGADLVWGHHPHVLQGTERRKDGLILYSAGNLISPTPASSALYAVRFRERKVVRMEILPVQVSGGKATLLGAKRAKVARAEITKLDTLIKR